MFLKRLLPSLATLALAGVSLNARAQIPVTDVGAILQLVTQVQTTMQQLQTAQNEFAQAQQTYQSMTGNRGMQNLLNGITRNYLPTDWNQLEAAIRGNANAFAALSNEIQTLTTTNAVLGAADLGRLSAAEQTDLLASRHSVALLQALTHDALQNTSGRFATIQQLINAIPAAADEKGALDLQARIQAESNMLQTDQSKLHALYESAQAERWAQEQRLQERAVQDVGSLRRLAPLGL
jgi:type IV secretion system protein VirB5